MKYFLMVCTFLLMFSCETKNQKTHKPKFLIGNWIRLNDKEDNKTYENWKTNFSGLGFTLKGKDTTFKEILSIVSINDTLNLKVESVNEIPTLFKFTQQTDTSFICENSKNEFPKKIKYSLENKQLKAIISNADFSIDFVFKKI